MENKTITLTDDNFDTVVLKNDKLILVDFWAPWCGPCKMISPILDELAEMYQGKADIAKLNIDSNSQTSTEYNIRTIPTMLLFKNGNIVESITGSVPKQDLIDAIENNL